MDNLTHSLAGWALGQTGLKRRTRKGLAALILGANLPDIDVFFGWVPWAPLAMHRGVTHSLIAGVVVLPAVLGALLWLLDRWQARRNDGTFPSGLPMRFGWLVALSYLGAVTHPLLDWQNVYAVQLLSLVRETWFHNDALFIIDLWVWLMLGTGIWLSRRRERAQAARWTRPALTAVAGVIVYIAVNGVIAALARATVVHEASGPRPQLVVASPPPILFWRREVIWREQGRYRTGRFDPLRSTTQLTDVSAPVSNGMNDPRAIRAAREPAARKFLAWSIMPLATVTETTCGTMVRFGDARYTDAGARSLSETVFLPTGGTGCRP